MIKLENTNMVNIPFHIIIPARLNATRLPRKMLLDLKGKPLIQRTYERALLCGANSVTIATDDVEIEDVAKGFGAAVCMTNKDHPTGTDRLAETVQLLGLNPDDVVVNIQGDEPLIPPFAVHLAVRAMEEHPSACTTTLCTPIRDREYLQDPNVVKVVFDKFGFALYFSRSQIPYNMNANNSNVAFDSTKEKDIDALHYRHLGLYAYRVRTLQQYGSFESSPLEKLERLEQLRILWQGEKIHVSIIDDPLPPGVDTIADLEAARKMFV